MISLNAEKPEFSPVDILPVSGRRNATMMDQRRYPAGKASKIVSETD
jgi:hypothetical protein